MDVEFRIHTVHHKTKLTNMTGGGITDKYPNSLYAKLRTGNCILFVTNLLLTSIHLKAKAKAVIKSDEMISTCGETLAWCRFEPGWGGKTDTYLTLIMNTLYKQLHFISNLDRFYAQTKQLT